jgi:hypothetical protein
MYKGFCHTCQEFLETPNKFCEKCGMMLEIIQRFEVQQNETAVYSQETSINAEHQMLNFQQPQHNHYQNNYAPQNNQGFQRNISAHSATNSNEATGSAAMKAIAKFLIAVVVIVCLGYGIKYLRNATKPLNDQQLTNLMNGRDINEFKDPEPQNPWFWSFFRNEPTAEEVFEKYEYETNLTGKDVTSQTVVLKGTGDFIGLGENSIGIVSSAMDFDYSFDMYMKSPDKMLVKMKMTYKENPILYSHYEKNNPFMTKDQMKKDRESFNADLVLGSVREDKWILSKISYRGETKTDEKKDAGEIDKFANDSSSLTMTFSRQEYQKIEFIGTDTIGEKIIILGTRKIGPRKAYLVKGYKPDNKVDLLYFDIDTGLVIKYYSKDAEVYIDNYGEFQGIKMPTEIRQKTGSLYFYMKISDIKQGEPLNDSIFLRSSY